MVIYGLVIIARLKRRCDQGSYMADELAYRQADNRAEDAGNAVGFGLMQGSMEGGDSLP